MGSAAHLLRRILHQKTDGPERKLYQFLTRILQKPGPLNPEESSRLDGNWQVVVRALGPVEVCSDSAPPTALHPQVMPEHGARGAIPLWLQGDWGDFAGDRAFLQTLVACIRDDEGLSSVPVQHRQRWSEYQRCGSLCGQRLPDGVAPLIGAIKKLVEEMPAYRKKVRRRMVGDTADARFLQGDWDVKALVPHAPAILQSDCVLSGGQSLQKGLQQLLRDERRRSKSRSRERQRQRDAEQRQRLATNPRLPGPYRKNLPDSLRVLYGGAEKTERRLFEFLDRAEIADRYLQSFHFQHCDYCKVGWFGSTLDKPNSCKLTARDRWNMVLAPCSEWLEPGKRICNSCSQEADRSAKAGGERCPRLFCAANDMDIGDTFPELDALTFFEEEILAPIQPMVRVYTLYATGMTELRGHVINVAQGGPSSFEKFRRGLRSSTFSSCVAFRGIRTASREYRSLQIRRVSKRRFGG